MSGAPYLKEAYEIALNAITDRQAVLGDGTSVSVETLIGPDNLELITDLLTEKIRSLG